MTLSREDLRDIINAGAVSDIFKAERAYRILRVIGDNAPAIRDSKLNFGKMFGVIQDIASSEVRIAVARLYDTPSNHNRVRCLHSLLNRLESEADDLPRILEKENLKNELARIGYPAGDLARIDTERDSEIARLLVAFLRSLMDTPQASAGIAHVKKVRDKRIAHNEAAHAVTGPAWSAVLHLLEIAKGIVGVVGWAYLSTGYVLNGEYILSRDAKRPAIAMRRLLAELGIIPRPRLGDPSSNL